MKKYKGEECGCEGCIGERTYKALKKEKHITIPVSWFEVLLRYIERYEKRTDSESLNMLLGYISSVKTILNIHKKV